VDAKPGFADLWELCDFRIAKLVRVELVIKTKNDSIFKRKCSWHFSFPVHISFSPCGIIEKHSLMPVQTTAFERFLFQSFRETTKYDRLQNTTERSIFVRAFINSTIEGGKTPKKD
jgi:hypothetical protein